MQALLDIITAMTWPLVKTRPRNRKSAIKYLRRSFQVTGLYAFQDATPIAQDERLVTDFGFADGDILETFDRINEHLGSDLSEEHLDLTLEQLAEVILGQSRQTH